MRRLIILLFVVLALSGCGEAAAVYTHVSEDDYISERYYLTEISKRDFGDDTPTDFGVFEKTDGGYRLLVNIGEFTEIYGARYHTLAVGDVLYLVRDRDILRYDLLSKRPQQSERLEADFFPKSLEVIGINAIDGAYVYVYALALAPVPAVVRPLGSGIRFKPYTAYFAVCRDKSGFFEVDFDEIPIQKRY